MLRASTHPRWFAAARRDLGGLLSDHMHCERKAAENALALVRRYPHQPALVDRLARLAHEETSHLVQMATLLQARGLAPRSDAPNRYARALLDEVRSDEPARRVDALLCAALIEARSHERLTLLARGFAAEGETGLGELYEALANAEDRHAELYVELAHAAAGAGESAAVDARLEQLGLREAEIIASLPFGSRVH